MIASQATAFGQLLTAQASTDGEQQLKAVRLDNGKPGRAQSQSRNNQPSNPFGGPFQGGQRGPKNGQKGQTALIKAMGRLLIRQETSLQVLKQNSAWNVYLQRISRGPCRYFFAPRRPIGRRHRPSRAPTESPAPSHVVPDGSAVCTSHHLGPGTTESCEEQRMDDSCGDMGLPKVGSDGAGTHCGSRPLPTGASRADQPAGGHGGGGETQRCHSQV